MYPWAESEAGTGPCTGGRSGESKWICVSDPIIAQSTNQRAFRSVALLLTSAFILKTGVDYDLPR